MKSVEDAIRNYEAGVKHFGVDNYRRCGDLEGWYNVAKCLHDAKKGKEVSLELMVQRYRSTAGA